MEQLNRGQTNMSSGLAPQIVSSTAKQTSQIDLIPSFHNTMPVNWTLQQWPSAERSISQSMLQLPMPVNLGSYQSLSMDNQPIQTNPSEKLHDLMPVLLNHDQSSSSNRLSLGPQVPLNIHSSPSARLSSQTTSEPPPKVQNVMANNIGMQHVPSSNKHPAPPQPFQKVKSGAFDSVRSKLRESLAASLAMVPKQKKQQQIEEKVSIAEHPSAIVGEIKPPVADSYPLTSSADEVSIEHAKKYDSQTILSDVTQRESSLEESQPKHASPGADRTADSSVVKDDLLQGHEHCWESDIDISTEATADQGAKRLKVAHAEASSDEKEAMTKKLEYLAFQIESELFKLFGGVNKKYKEKGRSLLFNLKDHNNPELRKRVYSGEIAPEHLCTMTAEELASKELSEWRQAKAEELAQMVVRPDSEDVRCLVKKTHKGEFQVELEQTDTISVEVGLGTSVVPHFTSKVNETRKRSRSDIKNNNHKASDRLLPTDNIELSEQNLSSKLGNLLQEKSDLVEELMEDDVKDPELLLPIVSLDEFMQALDSEPPFENLPVASACETPSSGTENEDVSDSKAITESHSPLPKTKSASNTAEIKFVSSNEGLESKLVPSQEGSELKPETASSSLTKLIVKPPRFDNKVKPSFVQAHLNTVASEATNGGSIWEGSIQLTISSLATVFGVFKCGERTSTQDWPSSLEIKGRVRLDAFEKFLQDIPLSRSRAVMIAQFHWKESISESGLSGLQEIIDSYTADERVGFAEPVEGVELYVCPPNQRMMELIGKCLPKEEADALELAADALVGVAVWRRLHSTISPRLASQHKHGNNTRRQFNSRKPPGINTVSTRNSDSLPSPTPNTPVVKLTDDDSDDDVPPGFGPKLVEDLPEFDFVHSSSQNSKPVTLQQQSLFGMNHTPPARPVDQIRQLIHKYGQSENVKIPSSNVHHWNNDDLEDDDIPEWQPNHQPQVPPRSSQLRPYLQQPQPFESNDIPEWQPNPQPQVPPRSSQLRPYLQQPQPFESNHQLAQTHPQQMLIHGQAPSQQQQNIHPQPFDSNHQVAQMHPNQMLIHPQAPPQQFVPLQLQLPLQSQLVMIPGPMNVQLPWQHSPWLPRGPTETNVNMVQPSYYNAHVNGQAYNVGLLQNGMVWRPDVPRNGGI